MAKIDLNKLSTEIENRKRDRGIISGTNMKGPSSKDEFLLELHNSLNTGKESTATNMIKLVENQVAVKNKENAIYDVQPTAVVRPAQPQRQVMDEDMSIDREEQLFADTERKRKSTLAESIEGFMPKTPSAPQQIRNQMNEGYLTESVKKVVDNYLIENFGPVVEEAIRGTIIEMYAVDRIKTVLQENRELIKGVVIEVIKEIQANAKKKAQQ